MAKESKILSTPSHDHEMPVELTANHMVRQGYTRVRASHTNRFTACDQIGEYIPDVTAFYGNAGVVAEAESRDGLVQAHTEAQWKTFYGHVNRVGGHFIAVVNKSDEVAARSLLTRVCGSASNVRLWTCFRFSVSP